MIFLPFRFGQSRATVSSVGATNPEVEAAVEADVEMAEELATEDVVGIVGVVDGLPEVVAEVVIICIVDATVLLTSGHDIGSGDTDDLLWCQV